MTRPRIDALVQQMGQVTLPSGLNEPDYPVQSTASNQ